MSEIFGRHQRVPSHNFLKKSNDNLRFPYSNIEKAISRNRVANGHVSKNVSMPPIPQALTYSAHSRDVMRANL